MECNWIMSNPITVNPSHLQGGTTQLPTILCIRDCFQYKHGNCWKPSSIRQKKERHELLSNLCHWFASKRGYHCTKQKQFTGHLPTIGQSVRRLHNTSTYPDGIVMESSQHTPSNAWRGSMDWLKGTITGKPLCFMGKNNLVSGVDFPETNPSIRLFRMFILMAGSNFRLHSGPSDVWSVLPRHPKQFTRRGQLSFHHIIYLSLGGSPTEPWPQDMGNQ